MFDERKKREKRKKEREEIREEGKEWRGGREGKKGERRREKETEEGMKGTLFSQLIILLWNRNNLSSLFADMKNTYLFHILSIKLLICIY